VRAWGGGNADVERKDYNKLILLNLWKLRFTIRTKMQSSLFRCSLLSTCEFVCDLPGGSVKSVKTLQSTLFRVWDYGSVFLDREPLRDIQPM